MRLILTKQIDKAGKDQDFSEQEWQKDRVFDKPEDILCNSRAHQWQREGAGNENYLRIEKAMRYEGQTISDLADI